jgi:hypothetical protein
MKIDALKKLTAVLAVLVATGSIAPALADDHDHDHDHDRGHDRDRHVVVRHDDRHDRGRYAYSPGYVYSPPPVYYTPPPRPVAPSLNFIIPLQFR